jgi:hypothetical protein
VKILQNFVAFSEYMNLTLSKKSAKNGMQNYPNSEGNSRKAKYEQSHHCTVSLILLLKEVQI